MPEGELLKKENIDKIRNIPTVIVQGRYICFLLFSAPTHA
jgi:proline iminopeptidase